MALSQMYKSVVQSFLLFFFVVGLIKLFIGQILDIKEATCWTKVKTLWFRSWD